MIPETSRRNYLTGLAALNIPSSDDTGDWHFGEFFLDNSSGVARSHPRSGIEYPDFFSELGGAGVIECSAVLKEYGVDEVEPGFYAAEHHRALSEMVINAAMNDLEFQKAFMLSDWFYAESDKERIWQYLERAMPLLDSAGQAKVLRWFEAQKLGAHV